MDPSGPTARALHQGEPQGRQGGDRQGQADRGSNEKIGWVSSLAIVDRAGKRHHPRIFPDVTYVGANGKTLPMIDVSEIALPSVRAEQAVQRWDARLLVYFPEERLCRQGAVPIAVRRSFLALPPASQGHFEFDYLGG